MDRPVFDIFKKTSKNDAVWVESVVSLHEAKKRLIALAASAPGSYLIFDTTEDRFVELPENPTAH